MIKLQVLGHDGKTVIAEYDIGVGEGQWNVHCQDEGDELLSAIIDTIACAVEPKGDDE